MKKPRKVFLIDDDTSFLRETSQLLLENGYEAAFCEKPTHSINRIRQFQPDCILLDVRMPLFDGRQMLPWLRRQWPDLPVIIVTAVDGVPREDFLGKGAFMILDKPFTAQSLFNAIESSIARDTEFRDKKAA